MKYTGVTTRCSDPTATPPRNQAVPRIPHNVGVSAFESSPSGTIPTVVLSRLTILSPGCSQIVDKMPEGGESGILVSWDVYQASPVWCSKKPPGVHKTPSLVLVWTMGPSLLAADSRPLEAP